MLKQKFLSKSSITDNVFYNLLKESCSESIKFTPDELFRLKTTLHF